MIKIKTNESLNGQASVDSLASKISRQIMGKFGTGTTTRLMASTNDLLLYKVIDPDKTQFYVEYDVGGGFFTIYLETE